MPKPRPEVNVVARRDRVVLTKRQVSRLAKGAHDTRERIARYLEHIERFQVGTILSDEQREAIGFAASWIRNRLDEKWSRNMTEINRVARLQQARELTKVK